MQCNHGNVCGLTVWYVVKTQKMHGNGCNHGNVHPTATYIRDVVVPHFIDQILCSNYDSIIWIMSDGQFIPKP